MTETRGRAVLLPEDLCRQAEEKVGQHFAGLEAFLTHVLSELVNDDAQKADRADLRVVEERLRELGYI